MTSLNNLIQRNYEEIFDEILKIDKDTYILSLVANDNPNGVGSSKDLLSIEGLYKKISATFNRRSNDTELIDHLFCEKIAGWNELLDNNLEDARYNPTKLLNLQAIAQRMFNQSTPALISSKLIPHKMRNEKVKKQLDKMGTLIKRILETPPLEKLTLPNSHIFTNTNQWTSLLQIMQKSTFSKSLDVENLEEIVKAKREEMQKTESINRMSLSEPSLGADWEECLIEEFAKLENEEQISDIGKKISTIQATTLISAYHDKLSYVNKIALLFGSLKPETLEEVLIAFNREFLEQFNSKLIQVNEETKKHLDETFSQFYSPYFINTCNTKKTDIDNLCATFRAYPNSSQITKADLSQVKTLADDVRLHQEAVSKLKILLKDIIKHLETKHVLFESLDKEYHTLNTRLNETNSYEERVPGCIYGIIYRKTFEGHEWGDTDNAFEILASWGVVEAENYRDVGLLGDIDDATFKSLTDKQMVYHTAVDNLNKMNIETIADWKKVEVFNKDMLIEFLKNSNKITQVENRNLMK